MSLRLHQALTRTSIKGFLLKEFIQSGTINETKHTASKIVVKVASPPCQDVVLSLAALNINSIRTPPAQPLQERIPPPQPKSRVIQLPEIQRNITYEDQLPTKTVEEPSPASVQEKLAVKLIVIRRKKMKKHKLRKLRKKMKFVWAKARQKREMKREKLFQAGLIEQIQLAEAFDPAKYVAEKIAKAKEVELPKVWYGVKYPDFIIKMLMEEKEKKAKEKESDENRRASMSPYVKDYLDKLPK